MNEHVMAVEVEFDTGGRVWVKMAESAVDSYVADIDGEFRMLSDIDHSTSCWCES